MLSYALLFFSGVGVFLFGLTLMTKTAVDYGEKFLEKKVQKILNNPFSATFMGFAVTSIIQSSTATNSLAVKLADEKLIDTKSSLYLIMGANIGTTLTAYLALLAKLELSNIIAACVFPSVFFLMITKNKKIKTAALIACCLSLVFIGLILINLAAQPAKSSIYAFMNKKINNFYLFFLSLLLTALFQSSSLTSVLLVSMCDMAAINMHTAMYMIMGINIGACFSVILTTIGCSKTGWFCVCFHLFFNIVGLMLAAFMLKTGLLNFFIKINAPTDFKTALFHTFFNVMTTTFLFYFIPEIDKTKNIFLFKAKKRKKKARVFVMKFPL